MSCEIHPSLVGCQVVIETSKGKVKGEVRTVDPTCSKLVIVNGTLNSSKLPGLYRIFANDIHSVMVEGENPVASGKISPEKAFVSKTSPPPKPSSSRNGVSRTQKCLPPHLRILDNNIDLDILTNKMPQKRPNDRPFSFAIVPYTVIENIDEFYQEMISTLKNQDIIGVSMEGIRIGRNGLICWIGVAINNHVFLLDMCSLGPAGVERGLKRILESPNIVKVTHDCRFMSDAFVHQYNVKLENVFDTQVAAAIEKSRSRGAFNRYVEGLTRCLLDYLEMPSEVMFQARVRVGHEKEDESRWQERPLSRHLLEGAVFNVCHLKALRIKLMERLLSEVQEGTEIYLKEISQLPEDQCPDKGVVTHLIPLSFEKLARSRNLKNGSEPFEDYVGDNNSCDPYLTFTRHIPHVKKSTSYI